MRELVGHRTVTEELQVRNSLKTLLGQVLFHSQGRSQYEANRGVLLKAGPRPSGPRQPRCPAARRPSGPRPTARDGPAARRPEGPAAHGPRPGTAPRPGGPATRLPGGPEARWPSPDFRQFFCPAVNPRACTDLHQVWACKMDDGEFEFVYHFNNHFNPFRPFLSLHFAK